MSRGAALLEAVRAFVNRDLDELSPEEAGDEMVPLRQAVDILELEFSRYAGYFGRTNEYDRQGSSTPIDWIRHNCKLGGYVAADRLCVGEELGKLPLSWEALTRRCGPERSDLDTSR